MFLAVFHADTLPPEVKQVDNNPLFEEKLPLSSKYEELIRSETNTDGSTESTISYHEQHVDVDVNKHENTSTEFKEHKIEGNGQELSDQLRGFVQVPAYKSDHEHHASSHHKSVSHTDKPLAKMEYLRPRIAVCGIGGAGCNAVNYMMQEKCEGVEYFVVNTDPQSLRYEIIIKMYSIDNASVNLLV